MKQVEFVKDGWKHSDDGINIVTYAKGAQDVSDACADAAIKSGYARPIKGGSQKEKPQNDTSQSDGSQTGEDASASSSDQGQAQDGQSNPGGKGGKGKNKK